MNQNRTIDAFIDSLVTKSAATQKAYRYSLNRFQAYLEGSGGTLDNLTRYDVQDYVSYLQTVRKVSAATVLREYAAISAFAYWSGQEKTVQDIRLPESPNTKLIQPKSLDRNERNRILREVERDGNVRNMAIIRVLYETGMRVGSLVALDKADVVMGDRTETSYVKVRQAKGNKYLEVPLSADARRYLREYLATRTDDCEALFIAERGAPRRISVRAVQDLCAKYDFHPHLMRHTRARTLLDKGADLVTVATMLGHSSIQTTMRYTRPSREQIAKFLDMAD